MIRPIPNWVIDGINLFKKADSFSDLQKFADLYEQYIKGNVDEELLLDVKMSVIELIGEIFQTDLMGNVDLSALNGLKHIATSILSVKDIDKSMQLIDLFLHTLHDRGNVLEQVLGQDETGFLKSIDPKTPEKEQEAFVKRFEETSQARHDLLEKIEAIRDLAIGLFSKGTDIEIMVTRIKQIVLEFLHIEKIRDVSGIASMDEEILTRDREEISIMLKNLNIDLDNFLNKFVASGKDQEIIRKLMR